MRRAWRERGARERESKKEREGRGFVGGSGASELRSFSVEDFFFFGDVGVGWVGERPVARVGLEVGGGGVGGVCHSSLCESKLWRSPERLTAFVGRISAQWLCFNGR